MFQFALQMRRAACQQHLLLMQFEKIAGAGHKFMVINGRMEEIRGACF